MQGKIVRHLTKDGIYLNGLFNEKKGLKKRFFLIRLGRRFLSSFFH